jgi:hypothetical protein
VEHPHLTKEAKSVLAKNWKGKYTRPAKGLYPHQWSWDSAFISIAYAHYDQEKAEKEMLSLFEGQWSNGMLPHIAFHHQSKEYSPGPEFWQSEKSPFAPEKPLTSGIAQPPIHATAVLHIFQKAKNREKALNFLQRIFPKLKAWHEYLYRERDPNDEGLVYIRHPWESGQDNSPIWDRTLRNIEVELEETESFERTDLKFVEADYRPTSEDYQRYVYLVKLFCELNYDEEKIRENSPFLIQGVLFNALLCRANKDLAEIARILDKNPEPFEKWAEKTAKAFNEKLWDEKHSIYFFYDMVRDELIDAHVASGFTPLFAHIPDEERAKRMCDYLDSHGFCRLTESCFAVPSYDKREPGYNPSGYWRGPVWINLNWLIFRGLEIYKFWEYAKYVRSAIIELPKNYGFREYYDPEEGIGYGAHDFSWTAALLLDVLHDEQSNESKVKSD